jgi:hypothetical protein
MPATVLKGVEPRSVLATRLKNLTIAEVADQPREEFIARVVKGASPELAQSWRQRPCAPGKQPRG